MQNRCAVPNCPSAKSDPLPLFRFPHDAERTKKWVEKCQNTDLMDKSSDQLYRYYRLCGKHFETSAFDGDARGTVLKDDAIPNVFDELCQPQNGQVKRSKETPKDDETESKGRKKIKKSPAETVQEDIQTAPEEDAQKKYLKSLFEVLVLLGEQSIPLTAPTDPKEEELKSDNLQALLECQVHYGNEVLKDRRDAWKQICDSEELGQMMDVCENHIRRKIIEEVQQNGFFSMLTDDPVQISGEWCLPVFLRYVDQSKCQREKFVGFLNFRVDDDDLPDKMLSEMTCRWGLDMKQCRGQAHSCSGPYLSQIQAFAAKLVERYPRAMLTFRSTEALNVSLANGMALSAVQLVMSTLKKIESFFCQSPLLQLEFEHAISMFYPDSEERANELKETCRGGWTRGQAAFQVALDVVEALLLCVDSVHDNEDMRWSDQVTHSALEISKALADFEFIVALVVLKHVTKLTAAFGTNLRGSAAEAHSAASTAGAVLCSLKEVADNIDIYHEFWYDEAFSLATAMEVPARVPRWFLRKHHAESGAVQPECYYKEHLSAPVVKHVMGQMSELFGEEHLKTLRGLFLVPAVVEQDKSTQPEEEQVQVFSSDIPNAATLSAELHCWWVKWSKKAKGETFPSSLQETLQLADVKFFPNVLVILRLLSILPTLASQKSCEEAHQRFRLYMKNTPDRVKSKSLALLSINYDVGCDLDSVVESYMKAHPDRQDAT